MNKLATAFAVPSDAQVADGNKIWVFSDPVTGQLYKPTGAQLKAVNQTFKYKHTAIGTEGVTLTISAVAGKDIIAIFRNGSVLYEVSSAPDEMEFIWDGTTITLGLGVTGSAERFLILYKTL